MVLERHERRLLAAKKHHPSVAPADKQMKRFARSILDKNCHPLVVIDGRHQWLVPPFPGKTDRAQPPVRTQRSEPRALPPGTTR
jgi:hypothetical protein